MIPSHFDFIKNATLAAERAEHIFSTMAGCEAALESAYGTSALAVKDKNLFGTKQHRHPIYGTHVLPTREFENGEWVVVNADWISYPSWAECFKDRMATLLRLASQFPHYKAALDAKEPVTYIIEVSKTWSTDPGWDCQCRLQFSDKKQADAHAAAFSHSLTTVPGLGRGLKVLDIYNEYYSQPSGAPVST